MKKKNNKEIDEDVKKSFGKFYLYSIIVMIGLIIYPFIISKLKWWFDVILLVFFIIFYFIMLKELFKKKGNYWTIITSIIILFIAMIVTLDVIKLAFFLIK